MLSPEEKSKVQRTAYPAINNLKSYQYLENRVVAETEGGKFVILPRENKDDDISTSTKTIVYRAAKIIC